MSTGDPSKCNHTWFYSPPEEENGEPVKRCCKCGVELPPTHTHRTSDDD